MASAAGDLKPDASPVRTGLCLLRPLPTPPLPTVLVGLGGIEPPTSPLSGVRSNQLSYRPGYSVRPDNLLREPATLRGPPRLFIKEVIQPQVPLRLPCYDFTPVADPTVAGCLLAVSAPSSGKTNSHGVTGGVYKARERIHRGILIRDY